MIVVSKKVEVVSNNTGLTVLSEEIKAEGGVNVIAKAYELVSKRFGINNITARMNYFVKITE